MCGIVGMAGNGVIKKDLEALEALLKISILRGEDSTGIFQGHFGISEPTYLIEKKTMNSRDFFRWRDSKNGNKLVLSSVHDNVFIGHTRSATKGSLTESNAQPFKEGDIIGVHNGTLLETKYHHKDISDSFLVYQDIAKRGLKAVVSELPDDNAYVFNFFDVKSELLYFVRNHQRPLHVCMNKHRNVIYWASEAGMLRWILDRLYIDYTDILKFSEHTIYTLDLKDIDCTKKTIPFIGEDYTVPALPVYNDHKKNKDYSEWWAAATNYTSGPDTIPFEDDANKTTTNDNSIKKNSAQTVTKTITSTANVVNCKIPKAICIGCSKNLKLVDQFFANKEILIGGVKVYECLECANTRQSIANVTQKHLH